MKVYKPPLRHPIRHPKSLEIIKPNVAALAFSIAVIQSLRRYAENDAVEPAKCMVHILKTLIPTNLLSFGLNTKKTLAVTSELLESFTSKHRKVELRTIGSSAAPNFLDSFVSVCADVVGELCESSELFKVTFDADLYYKNPAFAEHRAAVRIKLNDSVWVIEAINGYVSPSCEFVVDGALSPILSREGKYIKALLFMYASAIAKKDYQKRITECLSAKPELLMKASRISKLLGGGHHKYLQLTHSFILKGVGNEQQAIRSLQSCYDCSAETAMSVVDIFKYPHFH